MSPTPKRLLQDRFPRPLFLVLLFSLFSFLSLGSALLTSPSTHATSSSINVSITGSPVVTVTPNAEGKFASGEFAVGITTTHASGYTFSIKAAEGPNPTRLNGTTTEGFLASITSPISTDTFRNDSTYNEQWGYKPSVLYNSNTKENTANDNYLPSPSTAGDTLAVTHTAGDSSYPISIGTRVTVATVEDVYSNTFVFTAIVNPTPYTLTYNANTSDSVSNMPANISDGETNGETFEISSTVPTRSGYDFKGWCASQVADGAICPTTTYNSDGNGSNLTYTIDQTSATNNVNLYAVWKEKPLAYYAQDLTATECQERTTDGPITIYDRRDGSDYTVRYINGACWMTQNLRITGTISATDSNFSGADFNTKINDLTSGNSYTEARSHLPTDDDVVASSTATGGPYSKQQLGAWYNYCAATAGQICSQTKTDATQDICPAGWHLPNYKSNASAGSISSLFGSLIFSPVYGGRFSSGKLIAPTTVGYWWSSTSYDADQQRHLSYTGERFFDNYYSKTGGAYIRCVRK
ncbi:MAG: hypothetical protein K6G49_00910 [Candidatus Saccharibacteria bacterium]|nr:hypothetical protein [Candidatus Saccharibacteria bacterium]